MMGCKTWTARVRSSGPQKRWVAHGPGRETRGQAEADREQAEREGHRETALFYGREIVERFEGGRAMSAMQGRMKGAAMRTPPLKRVEAGGPLMTTIREWMVKRGEVGMRDVMIRFGVEMPSAERRMNRAEELGIVVGAGAGMERRWRLTEEGAA